jgi:hypothetical protein
MLFFLLFWLILIQCNLRVLCERYFEFLHDSNVGGNTNIGIECGVIILSFTFKLLVLVRLYSFSKAISIIK